MLGLVALVWALAPRDSRCPRRWSREPGDELIVAFGDSYISGEGASEFVRDQRHRRERGNQCRRAPTAYPVTLVEQAQAEEIPDKVLFLGCSGAVARDLWRAGPTAPIRCRSSPATATRCPTPPTTPTPATSTRRDVTAVLVSMGGNDAGFGDIGKACLAPGDCSTIGARFVDGLERVGEPPRRRLHRAGGGARRGAPRRRREPARIRDGLSDAAEGGRLLVDAAVEGRPRLHPGLRRRPQRHRPARPRRSTTSPSSRRWSRRSSPTASGSAIATPLAASA